MANAPKLPRTFKGASRELDVTSNAPPCDETQGCVDATDVHAGDRQDSVRRLIALCQKPSPLESSFRMERISAIRKAIAAGTYRISAAAIAEKLIEHMLTNQPSRTGTIE